MTVYPSIWPDDANDIDSQRKNLESESEHDGDSVQGKPSDDNNAYVDVADKQHYYGRNKFLMDM